MTNYPLSWPSGWKRTQSYARKDANFKSFRERLSVADGAERVLHSLGMMGVRETDVIISTNVQPTLSGRPRSSQAEPSDPGVAVYWKGKNDKIHKVLAVDRYTKVADNLAAVAATLEAMRAIERHGGAMILERAFIGFTALPAPNTWRSVFGYIENAVISPERLKADYRELCKKHHPDHGGSEAKMQELNWAMGEAEKELG